MLMIPTRKSLSNGFSPGGPSFAKDGGAFVPGIPQEPLATLPQTELQKSASVESGGSTNRYESYWRVDQRDASKALDGQKHDGRDGLPVNTPEAPKEVPPETPTAETPRTNQDEVEATERDTPDATRGDGMVKILMTQFHWATHPLPVQKPAKVLPSLTSITTSV